MRGYFRVFSFDTGQYRFCEWAADVLGVTRLAELHKRPDLAGVPVYDAMATCMRQLREGFPQGEPILRSFYEKHLSGALGIRYASFQCPPTFRVHLPDCPTISSFHRDMDYKMSADLLCAWLPLTDARDSNGLWIDLDGALTPKPINIDYGQFIVFDCATMLHGSRKNETSTTRVSFDSRFSPLQPTLLP